MEIKYFADHFGIDGQAVLVTSNSRTQMNVLEDRMSEREKQEDGREIYQSYCN